MTQAVAGSTRPVRTERPTRPAPRWGLFTGLAAAALITVWAAHGIGFTLAPLWTATDLARARLVLSGFVDPDWGYLTTIWAAWLQTLSIAVVAAVVGCSLGLAAALLASRLSTPNGVTYWVAKQVLSVIRSLPDVAYALLFVAAVGTGPLAGVLALVCFNLGIIAKLTSETIDAIDPGPVEAADAVGAGHVERARVAIVPQVLPHYLSYCLYVFELNVRASVILGYVGAGGIGNEIKYLLGLGSWSDGYGKLSAVIIAVFVVVLALDALSRHIRRRLV